MVNGWSSLNWIESLTKRAPLFARFAAEQTTIYRALHTTETQFFALDLAGSVGILSLYAPLSPSEEEQLAVSLVAELAPYHPIETLYLKRRPPEAKHLANVAREWLSPPLPLWGIPQETVTAQEQGVSFSIRPAQDLSIGLFTDARLLRAWVRAAAPSRVLNTFSYTCGFGLNATLGGSHIVKNVDLSQRVLQWGAENYQLNGIHADHTDFLYGDVFEWLNRLARRGDQFDLVILDPPSFARNKKQVWRAEKDYGRLVALASAVTAPRGKLLCVLNHAGVSGTTLEKQILQGTKQQQRLAVQQHVLSPDRDYPQARHLKAQVWQLD